MGRVYRLTCTACGQAPELRHEVRGFVVVPAAGPAPGAAPVERPKWTGVTDGYLGLLLDSGELVTVPHPGEHFTIERHGFTVEGAAREHRLFWVSFKICRDCGVIRREAQVHDQSGCLPMLISLPVFFLTLMFLLRLSWATSIFFAFVGMWFVALLASLIAWARWHKRNLELKVPNCPRCGGTRFVTVENAGFRRLMCPHCRTRNVRVQFYAIS